MESKQIEYLNLINLVYAFKNVRNMEKFLEENAHAHDGSHGTQPNLTRETTGHDVRYFTFHQLRMPSCEQQCLEGQGFSCLRAGYVGPRMHV